MDEAARAIAAEQGYEVIGHQFDLVGTCPTCLAELAAPTMPSADGSGPT